MNLGQKNRIKVSCIPFDHRRIHEKSISSILIKKRRAPTSQTYSGSGECEGQKYNRMHKKKKGGNL